MVTGRCRPLFPQVLAFNFYRAWGSAIPLLVDFSSGVVTDCRHTTSPDVEGAVLSAVMFVTVANLCALGLVGCDGRIVSSG